MRSFNDKDQVLLLLLIRWILWNSYLLDQLDMYDLLAVDII